MGGRWVAAALAVLGIISSMNLRVEGQMGPDPEALERIVKFYHLFVNSGLEVGAECDELDKSVLADSAKIAKMQNTKMLRNLYNQKPEFAIRDADRFETDYPKMAKEKKWCKMKAGLNCADKVCKKCPEKANRGNPCYWLIEIRRYAGPVSDKKDPENPHKDPKDPQKEPKDPQKEPKDPGAVSGGGRVVRPVDGALVAALLSLCALSA